MIADRLRALVAELRSSHGWIGYTRADYADRLEQILAEDAGGWRPIAEKPDYGSCEVRGIHHARDYCPCEYVGKLTHYRPLPEPPPQEAQP